jgi:4-hydroxybenzoate polyprenyltransferase
MLELMRPAAWLWNDILPALAMLSTLGALHLLQLRAIVGLLIGLVASDAAACVLNDIYDLETDSRCSDPAHQRPLVRGSVSLATAWYQFFVIAISSVLLVLWLARVALPAFAVCWVLAVAYSTPPIRLAARPLLCIPVWLFIGLGIYACVALVAHAFWTGPSVIYLLAVGMMMGTSGVMAKDIRDWDQDAAAGRHTLVVQLGVRTSVRLAMVSAISAPVDSVFCFWAWVRHRSCGFLALALALPSPGWPSRC